MNVPLIPVALNNVAWTVLMATHVIVLMDTQEFTVKQVNSYDLPYKAVLWVSFNQDFILR